MNSSASFGNISNQTLYTDRGKHSNLTDHPQSENVDTWWISITYLNLLLYVLSVFGNGILIAAFSRNAQMRTTTNMLVVSHLIAELLASSVGIATHLSTLKTDERPSLTSGWCVAGTSAAKICMGGGFLSLVGITVDRYLAVVKKGHHKVTKLRVQVFLTVIWTLSLTMYGIPWRLIFHSKVKWNYVAWLIVHCRVQIAEQSTPRDATVDIFQYLFLTIGIVLPFFTIAFTSYRILRTALQSRRRVGVIGTHVNHVAAAYIRSAFTTIIIISVYFLCLLPIVVLGAMCENLYLKCKYKWFFFFAKVTWCFKSACFPVIFAVRGRTFSRYIKQFFHKRVEICRKYLMSDRSRGSNKENLYHCSSSHTRHEPTTVAGNSGKNTSSRRIAFVDLENISFETEQKQRFKTYK